MATKTYVHPFAFGLSADILDYKTHTVRKRLPTWRECADPKPPFLTFGADNWNCAKCVGEKPFSLPVNVADSFQFQFQFDDNVNEDPADPVFGWQDSETGVGLYYMNARVLDCNCEGIGLDYIDEFASDYGVSYGPIGGSFQWLNLDIGLIPADVCCFYLQIEHYSILEGIPVNDQNIVAGPFTRNDVDGCPGCAQAETILICGTYKKSDCWGRRFDIEMVDGVTFSDCIRIPGEVLYLGTTSESTFDGEVEIKTSQRKRYRLELGGMPPMIAEWVSNILASNGTLTIGDYEINRANGDTVGSFEKGLDGTQMFHGSIEFTIVCEIFSFGCN